MSQRKAWYLVWFDPPLELRTPTPPAAAILLSVADNTSAPSKNPFNVLPLISNRMVLL